MNNSQIKIAHATGWSFFTEVAAKLISPIVNIILARLLSPEAFGVVATVTMVTSFAELISEAGFHRYIIQEEYSDQTQKKQNISVAFWTNLFFSLAIWFVIILFRDKIAYLVGADGFGNAIAIAAVTIPLMAFSSIQMAVFKRELEFRTLFFLRIISCLVPLVVTVPLAYFIRNFWALIVGSIVLNVINAVALAVCSKCKPQLFFSMKILRQMISFSIWSMLEQTSVWLTSNVGIFLVGRTFTSYYTGLYKITITTVNQILGLISSAVIPVAFSALSRCERKEEFNNLYYRFVRITGIVLIPMSFGILLFNKTATNILLGSQWKEASAFLGVWGGARGFVIALGSLPSEAFKAKGKPRIAFMSQTAYLLFLIPAIYLSAKKGFAELMYVQSMVSLTYIIIQGIFMFFVLKINQFTVIKNILHYIIAAAIMATVGYTIKITYQENIYADILNICICIIVYFVIVLLFRREREEFREIVKNIRKHQNSLLLNKEGTE